MIKSFNDAQMTEVYRQAMKQDFPPDELKPLSRILAQKRKNIALCLGYFAASIAGSRRPSAGGASITTAAPLLR